MNYASANLSGQNNFILFSFFPFKRYFKMVIITYDTKISIPGDAEYMTGLINVCFVFAKEIVSDNLVLLTFFAMTKG